ncbi:hypothetical protein O6H91_08G059900 [Diphasiastrum complanatum]|nr:hypothetical protein O6H91_08G059900 [Diphasiastrum complanatum]
MKGKGLNGGQEHYEKEMEGGLGEDRSGRSRAGEKSYREKDERDLGYGDASEGGQATRVVTSNKDSVEKAEGKTLWRNSKTGSAVQNSHSGIVQTAAVSDGGIADETETDKYEDPNSSRARSKGVEADILGVKSLEPKDASVVDISREQSALFEDNEYIEDELVGVSEEGRASSDAGGGGGPGRGPGSTSSAGRNVKAGSPVKARVSPPPLTVNNDSGSSRQGSAAAVVDGRTSVFVGELHWWTTDAELEAALSEYGRVKSIKFYEERASGKSKGYCLVEFCDAAAAHLCKEKMEGKVFNGRPCIVAFPSARNQNQPSIAQVSRNQGPSAPAQGGQGHGPIKKMGDRGGISGRGAGSQTGNGGRSSYGKIGMGQASAMGGGRGQTPGRSRGRAMGGNGPYSQGHPGPMGGPGAAGMMAAQGMMGQGYDAGFGPPMGRQNMGNMGYGMGPAGGFVPRAPSYPSMGPPYPGVGPGLPGVAPHVNPAFFGRGSNGTAMGKMGGGAMNGSFRGWDGSMSGWGGDENERWMRDGDFGDEMGSGEYGHGAEMSGERGRSVQSRDRSKGIDGDWVDWRRKGAKEVDWEREKHNDWDGYSEQQEGDWDGETERPQRIRSRSRVTEEDESIRYREEDHVKKRRYAGDRKIEK